MTLKNQIKYIVDTFKSGLPALLTTAGLDNFISYNEGRELKSTQLELCVYPDVVSNVTDNLTGSFLIKIQLYQKDQSIEYYDVINPFIKTNIKPSALGYASRVSITADFMPADKQSTSYVFFSIIFSKDLDDCED